MFPEDVLVAAGEIVERARRARVMVVTAESCTGGLVAAALTEIPGSSAVLERGFVTYSNEAKTQMLGVPAAMIALHGAVSEPVARAMAAGAVAHAATRVSVAVTGVAGPGGGTEAKPVGLVHFAAAGPDGKVEHQERRFGDRGRAAIRLESVRLALAMLARRLPA